MIELAEAAKNRPRGMVMNSRKNCWLGQSPRSDAREQIPGLLQNTARVNSSKVADLNPDQVNERPQRCNATVRKSQDCRLNQNDAQQHQ